MLTPSRAMLLVYRAEFYEYWLCDCTLLLS
jgi:hypothetical protein